MSRLFNGIGHYSSLCIFVHAVLDIGFTASLINDIDAAVFDSVLVALEGVTGKPHDPAGFGNVAKLLGQVTTREDSLYRSTRRK